MPNPLTSRFNGKKGGRPKGKRNGKTLMREAVLKAYQQRVMENAGSLLDTQFGLAKGSQYLFKIEKELFIGPKGGKSWKPKKPELVENPNEIMKYLEDKVSGQEIENNKNPGATYYYMTTKDPDHGAIKDMLDRSFGKPAQSVNFEGPDGKSIPITTINLIPVKMGK